MRGRISASNFPARADLVSSIGYGTLLCNSQHYRWNAIASVTISATTYQAVTFWNSSGKMVIGKRTLDGSWTLYTYDGSGGLADIAIPGNDNHDVCSIGIDPDGYIHVCYSMHGDALLYRKSDAAIDSWTGVIGNVISMVGTNETAVTYPTFINDPSESLYFLFRDEASGNADWYMYKYTHGTTTWSGVAGTTAGKLLDGDTGTPDFPYIDHPCFDADFGAGGYFHLSWHWRTSADENEDVCYVKWDGTSWVKADESSQTMPITHANCEIVDDTGSNLGLTSFNSLYSDSGGNPHLVYAKTNTNRYLYHAYHNGTSWTITQLTTTANPSAGDNSTSDIGLVPEIVIDRATDIAYVFYRDPREDSGLWLLKSADFSSWTKRWVYPYNVGWWNPKIDYVEFERSGNLYFSMEEYHGVLLAGSQSSFPIYVWKVDPGEL